MTEQDTKTRILDAAEQLFAEVGPGSASLRAITTQAGANIAAVNYHFGNRDELVQQVFERRLNPLNAERIRRLNELQEGTPTLESVVRALIEPAMELSDDAGAAVVKLMGQVFSQAPEVLARLIHQVFGEVIDRFLGALSELLPGLSQERLVWRVHFMIGSMAHTMAARELLPAMMKHRCLITTAPMSDELIAFCVAGLKHDLETGP